MSDIGAQATQDYLKAIYELCTAHGRATTGAIASLLDVTPASVTGMLQKLADEEPPLLEYIKRRGAALTPDGERIALETIRRHRLLECYLRDELGYRWDEVHDEAERLEHVISGAFEARIAEILDHPSHDPHGAPIPTAEFYLPPAANTDLGELLAGQTAIIRRVCDRDSALLRRLATLGMCPGTLVTVVSRSPGGAEMRVQIEDRPDLVTLSVPTFRKIFVEPNTGEGD